jgi:phage-related protein
MAAGPRGWQVDDWRGAGGARPVKDFIDRLSKPAKAKVIAALEMLEEHGNRLLLPHSRALGSGLQELRIAHPEGPFRVIYCYLPGRRIVLLHAFVKRTEAIRRSDLDVAMARKPAG